RGDPARQATGICRWPPGSAMVPTGTHVGAPWFPAPRGGARSRPAAIHRAARQQQTTATPHLYRRLQMNTHCESTRQRVLDHDIWKMMMALQLDRESTRNFMMGLWPFIERFPSFMALN